MWKNYFSLSEVLSKILIKILSFILIGILTSFLSSSYKFLPGSYNILTRSYKDFTNILLKSYQDVLKIVLSWYLDLTKILLTFCKTKRIEENLKLNLLWNRNLICITGQATYITLSTKVNWKRGLYHIVHIFASDLFWKSLIQILQKCTNGLLLEDKNIPPFTHYLTLYTWCMGPEGNS